MDSDKQQALESAGWKFGSVHEFLGERPMSDSDKMRAEFETYAEQRNWNVRKYHGSYYWAEAARAWHVWQVAYQAGRNAEQAEVERLRDENEWMGIAGQQMARHLAEAKAELAAAKAASVCPVEVKSVYVNKYLGSVAVFIGDEKGALEFEAWLTNRQYTTPPTT